MPVDDEAAIVAAAQALRQRHGFGAVLVTRGKDGMTLVDAAGEAAFPLRRPRCSTSPAPATRWWRPWRRAGAGSSSWRVRLSNIAAGVVVGKVGTAVAREGDLLAAISPRRRAAQNRRARNRRRACRALAPQGLARRFHLRRLRSAAARARAPAGAGAGEPATGWWSGWTPMRGAPAEGDRPSGAAGGGPRGPAGQPAIVDLVA